MAYSGCSPRSGWPAKTEYEGAIRRLAAREAELGAKFYGREQAEIVKGLPLAVTPEVGQILYALTLAARPRLVIEFGGFPGLFDDQSAERASRPRHRSADHHRDHPGEGRSPGSKPGSGRLR